MRVAAPFAAELKCPEWFPTLLEQCDGRRTGRELLAGLRAAGHVGPTMTDDDFADLLHTLSAAPFLDFVEHPAPVPAREMSPHFA
jgi:hypothetical protein